MRILLLVLSILLLFSAGCGEEGTTDNASWKRGPGVEAFLQGAEYVKKGQHQKALENFNEAIRLDPKMLPAYHGRSIIRRAMGDLEGAIDDYSKVINLDPKKVMTYAVRGLARIETGDLDGAIDDYSEAISLNPNFAGACMYRGVARSRNGDLDEAINDYSEAIRLDPNYTMAYISRGIARSDVGNLDGAIDDYNNTIHLNPKFEEAYTLRGLARIETGDLDGAIADYSKVIRLNPNDATAYNDLAWLLATSSNPKYHDGSKAVELALQATLLDKKNYEYVDTLAAAYARAGIFDNAASAQRKALAMAQKEPQSEEVIQRLKNHLDLYRQGKPFQEE